MDTASPLPTSTRCTTPGVPILGILQGLISSPAERLSTLHVDEQDGATDRPDIDKDEFDKIFTQGTFTFPPEPDKSDNAEIWRIYVTKSDEHDAALLKRWNEGIDVFLLFTGLFSAILSAFLIASWSTLQPDSGQATIDGLVAISQQLTALSTGRPLSPSAEYQPRPFVAPWWAVAVNGLWFTSLMLSLVAAVLAMLVKEWLSAYNENVATLPIERVQQRQFRYDGLIKWALPTIVSFLPLSIHIAVFLFFIGLAIFTWSVNMALCVLTSSLLCTSFCLYVASASAPLLFLDCPYKSPLSTLLLMVSRRTRAWMHGMCRPFFSSSVSADLEMGGRGPSRPSFVPNTSPTILDEISLQARAIAWLSTSSDKSIRECALQFLSRWKPPKRVWDVIRQDVQRASAGLVRDALLSTKSMATEADGATQKLALITCLFPARAGGYVERGLCEEVQQAYRSRSMSIPLLDGDLLFGAHYKLIGLNCQEGYLNLIQSQWKMAFPASIEGMSIVAEAIHQHAQHYPVNWELILLSDPFRFVFRGLARPDVSLPCLFKYLCVLGHALSLEMDMLPCCNNTWGWESRYPETAVFVGRLLVSCAERLEMVLDPLTAHLMTSNPLPNLHSGDMISFARRIQLCLLLCASRNSELFTEYELAALVRVTGRTLGACHKIAASGDNEVWKAAFGPPSETTSLIVGFCKSLNGGALVRGCFSELLDCLRFLVDVQVEPHLFTEAFERLLNCPAYLVPWQHTAVQFVGDGHLKDLVCLIEERSAPVALLALFVAREALLFTTTQHESSTLPVLRNLVSIGWLDCMSQYGMDYLFARHQKFNGMHGTEWLWTLRFCLQQFVLGTCELEKASALLERHEEGMKALHIGKVASPEEHYTGS